MPCSSSTACRFPDDVLHEASICFSSLPLAECEGLLGMPTSTNVSEPETNTLGSFFHLFHFELSNCEIHLSSINGAGMVPVWLAESPVGACAQDVPEERQERVKAAPFQSLQL